MTSGDDKGKPRTVDERLAELEQTAAEQADALLRMHAVIESHEKRIAVLEVHVRNGGNGTQNALREAAELARRASERRK